MKNEVMLFSNDEFGEIRTLIESDGTVLLCGKDVATALGYKNTRKAIIDHCKGVTRRDILTNGGRQLMPFIPESDFYRLVFGSKAENAEKFTTWVVEDVLPSIRKTGHYSVKPSPQGTDKLYGLDRNDALNFAKDIANGVGIHIVECKRRIDALERENIELERRNNELELKFHELEKRVSALESRSQKESGVVQTANTLLIGAKSQNNVTYIAEHYGMTAIEMNDLLAKLGVQFRDDDNVWKLTYRYSANDYVRYRCFDNPDCPKTMYWTRAGLVFIYNFLAEHSIYPKF